MGKSLFVLEIGTEDLPSVYVLQSRSKILDIAISQFSGAGLSYEEIYPYSTPRRIILTMKGLPQKKEESVELVKGPPVEISYEDDGIPAKPAKGFAGSVGVDVDDLIVREVEGREFVFAEKTIPEVKTIDILKEITPQIISNLKFSKTMRWNTTGTTFPRPIRWIVALLDDEVVEFEYDGLKSSNITYGHRIITGNREIEIKKADDYLLTLATHYVICSHQDRIALVEEGIERVLPVGARPEMVSEIERVVDTLEHPTVVRGSFDERHLKLPVEVIEATLMGYQDFLPIGVDDGLYPGFIAIHDGKPEAGERIVRGFERAITSRLEDASYFYEEDTEQGLDAYYERLSGIIFIEELGTMSEKAKRLVEITDKLSVILPEDFSPNDVRDSARLCKADLASLMIQEKEFSHLEGVMGGYYALSSGYSKDVAMAIREHYKPRGVNDLPPKTKTGRLIGIADKLDTLMGAFYLGMEPSGSEDPFALRRAGIGVIATLLDMERDELIGDEPWNVEIEEILSVICEAYEIVNGIDVEGHKTRVREFMERRLIVILRDSGVRYDIADAAKGEELDDVVEAVRRALGLQSIVDIPDFDAVAGGFKRVINIVRQGDERGYEWGEVDVELFEEEGETELYRRFLDVKLVVEGLVEEGDYGVAFKELAELRSDVDRFFDNVLVMCDDETLRSNRLALMERIGSFFLTLADFTKIVIE